MNPGNAWRRPGEGMVGTIACSTYLARHSDYLDGELTSAERLAHEAHEAVCAECARYAAVLRRGSSLLHELPEIAPSADFQERLQHRIFHVQDDAALHGGHGWQAGRLVAAAVFVLLAGGGSLIALRQDATEGTPAAASATEQSSLQLAQSWTTPAAPRALPAAPLPPPVAGYSPVVVRPPLYQPVSYELLAGE